MADHHIYYQNFSQKSALYRMDINGDNIKLLDEDAVRNIYVEGEWIFYTNVSENNEIYKIKTDGSEKSGLGITLNNAAVFHLYNNSIYYTALSDQKVTLYRSDLSGTHIDEIQTIDMEHGCFSNERYFYVKQNNGTGVDLYKLDLLTAEEQKVYEDIRVTGLGINVLGDWVYYINKNNDRLYRISSDGKLQEQI